MDSKMKPIYLRKMMNMMMRRTLTKKKMKKKTRIAVMRKMISFTSKKI
jgi:hypothetical protein